MVEGLQDVFRYQLYGQDVTAAGRMFDSVYSVEPANSDMSHVSVAQRDLSPFFRGERGVGKDCRSSREVLDALVGTPRNCCVDLLLQSHGHNE